MKMPYACRNLKKLCNKTNGQKFVLIALFVIMIPGFAETYVMPAEQLVGLMNANFSAIKTMVITQTVSYYDPQLGDKGAVYKRMVWLKSPGFYHSEFIDASSRQIISDSAEACLGNQSDKASYWLLTASNNDSLLLNLERMGINTDTVALTRYEGTIVYCIGEKGLHTPNLLVEKERFLPLALSFTSKTSVNGNMVTVLFQDYREIGGGWHPYKISCFSEPGTRTEYSVLDIKVNTAIDDLFQEGLRNTPSPSLSMRGENGGKQSPADTSDKKETSQKEEQLQEIIRMLKKKYQ